MKIKEIFDLAIELGIKSDLRGEERVKKILERKKEQYNRLSEKDKEFFDIDALENPYMDSHILNIAEDKEIKKILTGVDITGEELFLAREMGVDLVLGHHPIGVSLAWLSDVMNLQIDVLNLYGVPVNQAEKLTKERISEVARSVDGANHNRLVDLAKLAGVNFMNVHTPCDNLVANFLKELVEERNPEYVNELVDLFKEIPEYREAIKLGVGPSIYVGSPDSRCGKIALSDITGGTEGNPKIYEKIAQAGIGTVVGMHMSEKGKKESEEANINIVIAGHISSDSLGMNLFLDELEKRGIEIIPCGGLTRVKRF
jgi:putative NIF3 family GTP cyclohydrolase 1 type 2